MRLVAVSIVKNEADIIEAFVRHTLAWVDHHLVFDHDSTDGTRQILGALKAEGLPLTLFTDDALGNLQQYRSNALAGMAVANFNADWVIPLDADEILAGSNRAALEIALGKIAPLRPATLLLLNYYPTSADDPTIANPILRLRHCQASPPRTKKIVIPATLIREPGLIAGKGNHALYRGETALADEPLPEEFHLCHLALRSPQHQALRVVLAELQKLSRGQAHAGLDVHYRLGFQLLAENPDLFFATVCSPQAALKFKPIEYRGTPSNPNLATGDWNRVARAILPFLEKLAASHGNLLDRLGPETGSDVSSSNHLIRELTKREIPPFNREGSEQFSGFSAISGWGHAEGPVPEAFLPPFHWGFAPFTHVVIAAEHDRTATLFASGLSYVESQQVRVELNGTTLLEFDFPRVNQKEKIVASLPLKAGKNDLRFHYAQALVTDFDSRKLAMIFLSLLVTDTATP